MVGKRGRPVHSQIRQNVIEILYYLKKGYGYQISKIYKEIFPTCTREVIYYHLKKGVKLNEFTINEVKLEKGDFSWGKEVEKTYYELGAEAHPKGEERIKEFMEKRKI